VFDGRLQNPSHLFHSCPPWGCSALVKFPLLDCLPSYPECVPDLRVRQAKRLAPLPDPAMNCHGPRVGKASLYVTARTACKTRKTSVQYGMPTTTASSIGIDAL